MHFFLELLSQFLQFKRHVLYQRLNKQHLTYPYFYWQQVLLQRLLCIRNTAQKLFSLTAYSELYFQTAIQKNELYNALASITQRDYSPWKEIYGKLLSR